MLPLWLIVLLSTACFDGLAPTGRGAWNLASAQSITGGGEDGIVLAPLTEAYAYTRDDITLVWTDTDTTEEAFEYFETEILQFYFTTHGPLSPELNVTQGHGQLGQIPVAGGAVVMAYNLAGLGTRANLTLNGTVAANIWSGKISEWNDASIAALNPGSLLSGAIKLVYYNDSDAVASISSVFQDYVNSWGAGLNGTWMTLPNTTNNTVMLQTLTERVEYVKANSGSMTYMTLAQATQYGLPFAAISRSSTTVVTASVTTITTALTDFTDEFLSYGGNKSLSIINTPTLTGWPISYMVYITIPMNYNLTNCVTVSEFVLFVSWITLNNQAGVLIESVMHAELPIGYRRSILNNLKLIECNNVRASTTSYIIGMGSPFDPSPTLAYYYSSSSFELKYYEGNSATALADFEAGAIDYGQATAPIAQADIDLIGDLILIPDFSFAVTPSYNVPELVEYGNVQMNWTVVSDIYLQHITMWNDPAIAELNPGMASALPAQPILLVYQSNNSTVTSAFNVVISQLVPEYAQKIGPYSGFGGSPIVQAGGGIPIDGFGFPQALAATAYTFGLCISQQLSTQVKGVMVPNPAGNYVAPNNQAILSAINDNLALVNSGANLYTLDLAPGPGSWPIVVINSMMLHQRNMADQQEAAALVNWIYWINTDSVGQQLLSASGFLPMHTVSGFTQVIFKKLVNITSQGVHVSQIYGCVDAQGLLCSGYGNCTTFGTCTCDPGRTGSMCQQIVTSASDAPLAIGLSLGLTAFFVGLCLLIAALVSFAVYMSRRRTKEDWLINADEVEIRDAIGSGGFGEVHRAMWKGTDVAVKMLPKKVSSNDKRIAFLEEMRIMSRLRHPNVVLFKAACDRPPRMFIVMEWMSLGSLFDLLHNELVPDIPYALQIKMLYQAAKGMHFLHSSNIVHRDLKSLNLLLDNKWNVKVSDFGLTRIKDSVKGKKGSDHTVEGSVPWMSPEALSENISTDGDYTLCDVYAFGVIMWEVMTREQPYYGWTPSQVAVSVITKDTRPTLGRPMPKADQFPEYNDLLERCWARDPTTRPVFLDIMKDLQMMGEDMNLESATKSGSSSESSGNNASSSSIMMNSTGGSGGGGNRHRPHGRGKTFTSSNSGNGEASSNASSSTMEDTASERVPAHRIESPRRDVTFVVCDLARFNEVWKDQPDEAEHAIREYIKMIRALSADRLGHVFSNPEYHSGGTAMIAFERAHKAVLFALSLQSQVAKKPWPIKGGMIASRVSVHFSEGPCPPLNGDRRTGGYDQESYKEACRINMLCQYGHVTGSAALVELFHSNRVENDSLIHNSKGLGMDVDMVQRRSEDGDYTIIVDTNSDDTVLPLPASTASSSFGSDDGDDDGVLPDHDRHGKRVAVTSRASVDAVLGLCSSNACPWIIKSEKISIGKLIGEGSYGSVSEGHYNGMKVAIKRLLASSRVSDAALRMMRREAAVLSRIDHPNIIKMVGMSIANGDDRLIVMEFAERGCLSNVLRDKSVKLPWKDRVIMLRNAAVGIQYLHQNGIIHRDIKSSNILIDGYGNIKVADFGFATMIREQATMTRCGTPAWSAPEILLNKKYNEKADVYSFGIVMWEVLTRSTPYPDKNPFGLAVDVINGERPAVPSDIDAGFANFMKKCWSHKPNDRPSMDDIIIFLNSYGNMNM